MNNPTLYFLLYQGAKVDFTPPPVPGQTWPTINVMWKERETLFLHHMVGNHIEELTWKFCEDTVEEAVQVLIRDGVWPFAKYL